MVAINNDNTPKEIKVSELPQAVQKTLKKESLVAQRVFLLYKDDQPIYQVEATKGGEQVILHYNANGVGIEG